MLVIKFILLVVVFLTTTYIGISLSNKYKDRVIDLKEMQLALNMLETKIKFTYSPLPEIFTEISEQVNSSISNIFKIADSKMKNMNAGEAWQQAIKESNTNLNYEDINTLRGLSKLLGKTDVEGQVSQIEIVRNFIETQIKQAEIECQKNRKLYKTLGIVTGLGIVIILI